MNNLALKVFDNEQFGRVRTITKDEHTWFVGLDVARALGYKKPRNAVNMKVWKQNKDICSLFTPAVTQTCVPKIGTQGQDRDADEYVCKTHTKSEMGVYINRLTPKGLDKVVSEILRGEKPIVSIALF